MSKNPAVLLLEHHLQELKRPPFRRDYASVGNVCSQERCDSPTYLLRLAERELIDRERRATERRIKEAAFPVLKTIETFDFAAQGSINEPRVRELLRGEYIRKRENLRLVGNPGTGKTHLATTLGFAACSQGKRVRCMTPPGWEPSCSNNGRRAPCSGCTNNWNGWMCSSWMSWVTSRSPRPEPNCSSTG